MTQQGLHTWSGGFSAILLWSLSHTLQGWVGDNNEHLFLCLSREDSLGSNEGPNWVEGGYLEPWLHCHDCVFMVIVMLATEHSAQLEVLSFVDQVYIIPAPCSRCPHFFGSNAWIPSNLMLIMTFNSVVMVWWDQSLFFFLQPFTKDLKKCCSLSRSFSSHRISGVQPEWLLTTTSARWLKLKQALFHLVAQCLLGHALLTATSYINMCVLFTIITEFIRSGFMS